jgi:regulator of protease activity HflC (stomatin/prohibitin superfamily)
MGRFGAEEEPLVSHTTSDNTRVNTHSATATSGFLKFALLILVLILLCDMFFVIPPGAVGIVIMLGKVEAFESGMHCRFPFLSHLEIMSAKTQLLEEKNIIPTKEGLMVVLDTAVLYHLDASKAATLYREVGANYEQILLKPEAASAVRGLTSESEAKALYSSGRTMIQDTLKEELVKKLGPRGIIIEDVLLKDIGLPEELSKSIELKVQAEQESARMVFVLQKEQQEAQRKAIEAGGVADFQRIVSQGISPELLKWKGIEATEKFANSPNTKIVIMGNGGDSLPVILSADNDHN